MVILSIIQIGIFNMDHLDFTNGPFLSKFEKCMDINYNHKGFRSMLL